MKKRLLTTMTVELEMRHDERRVYCIVRMRDSHLGPLGNAYEIHRGVTYREAATEATAQLADWIERQ